jgi:hypothetical protein
MNKLERKNLIQQLAAKKKMVSTKPKKAKKKTEDFIAYIDPSQYDIQDELSMLSGYTPKKTR